MLLGAVLAQVATPFQQLPHLGLPLGKLGFGDLTGEFHALGVPHPLQDGYGGSVTEEYALGLDRDGLHVE